jgi:branched-chain amino acid transport system substrate-binding protein
MLRGSHALTANACVRQTWRTRCVIRVGALATALSLIWSGVTSQYILADDSEPGLKPTEIVIGSCAPLTGPTGAIGHDLVSGAQAYLDYVNDSGGVHGRKIVLVSADDGVDPGEAPVCYRKVISRPAFAIAFVVGTQTALRLVPLADRDKIPVVGLAAGAEALSDPVRRDIFYVRASYVTETHQIIDRVWSDLQMHSIGVIYPDDPFGASVLESATSSIQSHGGALAAASSYTRMGTSFDRTTSVVRKAGAQAVLVVGPYGTVASIIRHCHLQGWHPIFLTLSYVGTDEFIGIAGDDAEGVVITQVVPPSYETSLPAVALYHKYLAKYQPDAKPTFAGLEGFVQAVVLVEGIKRAGHDITRAKLAQALESLRNFDLGIGSGEKLNYSATDHQGLATVIPTVVRGGRAVAFNDWSILKANSAEK